MEAKILKTESEYLDALRHVETLMDAAPGSLEAKALELWSLLVEDYEKRERPIDSPVPVTAIRFRMEQQGLVARDLEPFIGGKSKVSGVLNGKRQLSLNMIRRLHWGLGIPLEALIQASASEPERAPRRSSAV